MIIVTGKANFGSFFGGGQGFAIKYTPGRKHTPKISSIEKWFSNQHLEPMSSMKAEGGNEKFQQLRPEKNWD